MKKKVTVQQLKFQTLAYCMSLMDLYMQPLDSESGFYFNTFRKNPESTCVYTYVCPLGQPQMYSCPLLCYFFSTSELHALVSCPLKF